jgi:hypothetical protein
MVVGLTTIQEEDMLAQASMVLGVRMVKPTVAELAAAEAITIANKHHADDLKAIRNAKKAAERQEERDPMIRGATQAPSTDTSSAGPSTYVSSTRTACEAILRHEVTIAI